MADIFVTTDLHLYSEENDPRHPYRSQKEVDALAAVFANTLHEDDLLIFLGDLCDPTASDFDKVSAFVRSIPCTKYMCKGNHDVEDDEYYIELGVDRVCDIIRMHNVIFSHKPVKVAPDELNIHGHLHTQKLSGLSYQHINAYGARWNQDGPLMRLEDLIASATVQHLDIGEAEQSRLLKEFDEYTSLDHDQYQNIIDITDEIPVHPIDETAHGMLPNIKTPEQLSAWMKKNIKYADYTTLKRPEETIEDGVGSCHDQVALEYAILKRMKVKPKILFFMAYRDGSDVGGMTHSLIYYADPNHRGINWFENAWRGQQGIHWFDSTFELKGKIEELYAKMPDAKKFPNLEFKESSYTYFSKMYDSDLSDFVSGIMDETAVMNEVLFQDSEDTKLWMKDDDEAKKKADKGDAERQSVVAIDESVTKKVKSDQLVFLSQDSDWDENVISPRIPDNFMTKNGYEDSKTPRVCFSTSIDKALRALSQKCTGMVLYVYRPNSDNYKVITPTKKQVPDVDVTDERWITVPVALECIGQIKVIGDAGGPPLPYTYGKGQTAELFDWDWQWEFKYDDDGNVIRLNETAKSKRSDVWYHMVPRGTDMSKGICSLQYMKDNRMDEPFNDGIDKYRDRMVSSWGIYPGRAPETLTDDELIVGLNQFRKTNYGSSCIYLFRYPPSEFLGPNMAAVLAGKDIYEVDLTKVTDVVYMGFDVNDGPGKKYYQHVRPAEYFSGYDDDAEKHGKLLFAGIPHVAVATKSGRIPPSAITKVEDFTLYHGSPKKYTKLKAQVSPAYPDEKSVYATPSYDFALAFAGAAWSDMEINQTMVDDVQVLTEILPGMFDKKFNRPGYIHCLHSNGFYRHSRRMEYVSMYDITPYKVEKVPNVLAELKKCGVQLYHYPELPPHIPSRAMYLRAICDKWDVDYDKLVKDYNLNESSMKSDIDPNHEQGRKLSLSSLKKFTIDEKKRKNLSKKYKFLKHFYGNDEWHQTIGWMDRKGNLVAAICVSKPDAKYDGQIWLSDFEITKEYRGRGLSKQIVDYACRNCGVDALGVATDNKIARKVYEDYGFKYGKDVHKQDKAGTNRLMYLPENVDDFILVDPSNVEEVASREAEGYTWADWKNRGRLQPMVLLDEVAIGEYKNGVMKIPVAHTQFKSWVDSLIKRYHAPVNTSDIVLVVRGEEDYIKKLAEDCGYSEKDAEKDVKDGVSGHVMIDDPLNVNILERKYVNRPDMTYEQIVKHECAHAVINTIRETTLTSDFQEGLAIYESGCLDSDMRRYKANWKGPLKFRTANYPGRLRAGIQARNIVKNKGYGYLIDVIKGKQPHPTYGDFMDEATTKLNHFPDITAITVPRDNPNDTESSKGEKVTFYEKNDILIGECSVSAIDTDDGFLYDLEVYPKYRGKGYANSIMTYMLDHYKIGVLCVLKSNTKAINLYKKFGFVVRKEYKDDGHVMLDMRYCPENLEESVVETHPMDRDEKRNVAEKYGLRPVGQTHDAAKEDEAIEREKRLRQKEEDRKEQLAKARKMKKKKAFVRKLKSHIPGVKNEDATAVENDAFYLTDPGPIPEKDFMGERHPIHKPYRNPEDATVDESAYSFNMLDRIQFFDRIDETSSDDGEFAPVYVVLIRGNSPVSKVITTFTGSEFTHASITFDSSLTKMYSFAGKNVQNTLEAIIGGFKLENIKDKFYRENDIPYAVYLVPSTKGAVKRMKKRLDYFIKNETKFTFDYLGLVKNFFKIPDDPQYTWFCSRFVADILNAGTPNNKLIDTPSLYRPEDFKTAEFAHFVGSGLAAKYDRRQVDRRTKSIENAIKMQKMNLHESAFCPDSPYEYQVLGYQLAMMDENAVDKFVQYLKSFKIRVDNDGNILITRREFDQLDGHFRESLRMIKTYENAGNVVGVKDELCKINYMIELINQYYLREDVKNLKQSAKDVRKDMLDLRSVMMNVFRQHMEWVTVRDPKFNFQRYYDNHNKYGKNVMIPKKVVTSVGRTIITALA